MFTKRELYILASLIFDKKILLKKSFDDNNGVFDDYLELSSLHIKIKDLINGDKTNG